MAGTGRPRVLHDHSLIQAAVVGVEVACYQNLEGTLSLFSASL